MVVLRAIVIFLLGIGFALGVYYSGGMQWMQDRWYDYRNAPPPVAEAPLPAPVPAASYPGATAAPIVPSVPYPNGEPAASPYPPENGENADYGTGADDATPETPEPTYTPPPGDAPPVGVTPLDAKGPPLSLHISIGRRSDDRGGCVTAYTVFNDTARPILLTQRAHYRGSERGLRDKVIVLPGERQIACAADVYSARDGYPHFDYYRQNVWYGPDAIDVPLPVNIRVKE